MASVQPNQESVRVTKESVMAAIRSYVEDQAKPFFTTLDIARHMGVDEYPVRAAVSWLSHQNLVGIVPGVRCKRYTRTRGEQYDTTVYQLRNLDSGDIKTLMLAFFR